MSAHWTVGEPVRRGESGIAEQGRRTNLSDLPSPTVSNGPVFAHAVDLDRPSLGPIEEELPEGVSSRHVEQARLGRQEARSGVDLEVGRGEGRGGRRC